MTTKEEGKIDFKTALRKFDLQNVQEGINQSLSNEWWLCESVYVSDICIAIHIVPNSSYSRDKEDSRKALYKLLRNISATALITDVVRPVAAVISNREGGPVRKENYLELNQWSADQAWHRGHFCLYVVPDIENQEGNDDLFTVERMLYDLLSPEPEVISGIEPISVSDIVKRIETHIKDDSNELVYVRKLETWWRDDYKVKDNSPNTPSTWLAGIRKEAETWIK